MVAEDFCKNPERFRSLALQFLPQLLFFPLPGWWCVNSKWELWIPNRLQIAWMPPEYSNKHSECRVGIGTRWLSIGGFGWFGAYFKQTEHLSILALICEMMFGQYMVCRSNLHATDSRLHGALKLERHISCPSKLCPPKLSIILDISSTPSTLLEPQRIVIRPKVDNCFVWL